MTRPSRATTSGRAYLDLLARARREGRPADELLTLYVLERFLYRLSVSAHRDRLVLKGGMLLSAFGRRRPTRDIDLLAKATSNGACGGRRADPRDHSGSRLMTASYTTPNR